VMTKDYIFTVVNMHNALLFCLTAIKCLSLSCGFALCFKLGHDILPFWRSSSDKMSPMRMRPDYFSTNNNSGLATPRTVE